MRDQDPTVFHEGEIYVQRRAGEEAIAARTGGAISNTILPGARPYLAQQRMVAAATVDRSSGRPWASLLFGEAGFVTASDGTMVTIARGRTTIDPTDVFWSNVDSGVPLGLLAIEFNSRRRLRVNGIVSKSNDDGIELAVRESYSNCPKYIQRRHLIDADSAPADDGLSRGKALDPARLQMVTQADTMFVATQHPTRGADVSHRGGERGFVRAIDNATLRVPDYVGNRLFNTLGNAAVNDRAGLAIPDFERARVLQLVGHITLHFGLPEDPLQPAGGTGRYWDFHVLRWIERPLPKALRWSFLDASPFNPPASKSS